MPAYSPTEIHRIFRDAFNLADVEALIALYEPDAILIVDGKRVRGHDEIRTAYTNIFVRRGRMTLETRAAFESENGLALLYGGWAIEPVDGTGDRTVARGISTEVVRRQPDGTWLFVIDNPRTPA